MHFGFISWSSFLSTISFNRKQYCPNLAIGLVVLSVALFPSCGESNLPETSITETEALPFILKNKASLFDQPDGNVTQILAAGQGFQLSGQISAQLYFRRIGKDSLLEPFLEVILADSSKHWLYANPAYFNISEEQQTWQWNNRLRAVLSPDQYRKYLQVTDYWQQGRTNQQFLLIFQATRQLRSQIEDVLADYPMLSVSAYDDVLPGCWSYEQSGHPAWWLDYNQWLAYAQQSADLAAEQALLAFYAQEVYPPDGIEYKFPAWQFQVSSQRAHSLLGRGEHLRLLRQLDRLESQYPFVSTEWDRVRNFLLEDLTSTEITYWEDWHKIDEELQLILVEEWPVLSPRILADIQLHHERLAQQATNGSQFNYRNR